LCKASLTPNRGSGRLPIEEGSPEEVDEMKVALFQPSPVA